MKKRIRIITTLGDGEGDVPDGDIIVFGEGPREEIQVFFDTSGRLRISAHMGTLLIEPQAANSVFVRTDS